MQALHSMRWRLDRALIGCGQTSVNVVIVKSGKTGIERPAKQQQRPPAKGASYVHTRVVRPCKTDGSSFPRSIEALF